MGRPDFDTALSVRIDASGNVYLAGYYSDTVDFDPGNGVDNHTWSGFYDSFLLKLNPTSNFLWARTWAEFPWTQPIR